MIHERNVNLELSKFRVQFAVYINFNYLNTTANFLCFKKFFLYKFSISQKTTRVIRREGGEKTEKAKFKKCKRVVSY